jgi:hypothetical protein
VTCSTRRAHPCALQRSVLTHASRYLACSLHRQVITKRCRCSIDLTRCEYDFSVDFAHSRKCTWKRTRAHTCLLSFIFLCISDIAWHPDAVGRLRRQQQWCRPGESEPVQLRQVFYDAIAVCVLRQLTSRARTFLSLTNGARACASPSEQITRSSSF